GARRARRALPRVAPHAREAQEARGRDLGRGARHVSGDVRSARAVTARDSLADAVATLYGHTMAIEQSFMKSLFHGIIAEELVLPYPEPSQEERDNLNLMLDSVRRFAEQKVDAAKIDREHEIPKEVIDGLKELGLFGLLIPQEYGGLGVSATAYA